MAKRKLTKQQQQRIDTSQVKKRDAFHNQLNDELNSTDGRTSFNGVVIANFGSSAEVEDLNGNSHLCSLRQNLEDIVCGDHVIWQANKEHTGVIISLIPRHTLLTRPDQFGRLKKVAANINQILVVAAVEPIMSEQLIDQYLVAAENINVKPVIVINKIDILNEDELINVKNRMSVYKNIDYKIIYTSVKNNLGLRTLAQQLDNQTNIFVGHSGVGKSSLIQNLLPLEDIRIGDLSTTGDGKHTTSVSRLYHLLNGGNLIDSPGVRSFGIDNLNFEDIAYGFIEFREFLGNCRFSNCQHSHEPGCAIIEGVQHGKITKQRFDRFQKLVAQKSRQH